MVDKWFVVCLLSVFFGSIHCSTYTNPILNRDFPDPTVIKGGDGLYHAYSTQSAGCNICVTSSKDLINWGGVSSALQGSSWLGSATWAPDVSLHNGTYYMFFAGSKQGTNIMCVGLALSTSPTGPFKDVGAPLVCSPSNAPFSAIDPKMFDANDGKIYLYWGSDFIPIQVQQLDSTRRSFASGSKPISLVPTSSSPYENLVEGAWVTFRSPYYYIWYSGDNCCGANAHYAVSVARSTSPTGPFQKLGNPILTLEGRWKAPGHNSVVTDAAGQDWIFYHAIDVPTGDINTRKLLMDKIEYVNGWPQLVNGGHPSQTPQEGPVV